jgi:hypothetical protein
VKEKTQNEKINIYDGVNGHRSYGNNDDMNALGQAFRNLTVKREKKRF